ncbi:hypothetical protein ACIPV3_30175 [Streptomyces albidoflavus]
MTSSNASDGHPHPPDPGMGPETFNYKKRGSRPGIRPFTYGIPLLIFLSSAVYGIWLIGEKAGLFAVSALAGFAASWMTHKVNTEKTSDIGYIGESRQRLTRAEGALEEVLREHFYFQLSPPGDGSPEGIRPPWGGGDHIASGQVPVQRSLGLPELWEATHARLTLYHDIATGQAKTSFRNAQISMAVGFILLLVFALLALNAKSTTGAIVAGALGAVSAALSGFVSKTFIRSQEAAATHLRSYFDQPLELSRYLAAERLVADGGLTQEQRAAVLTALVQAMVAPPASDVGSEPQAP